MHTMQVWLNGRVVPLEQAHISPFDRGFLFGDGIYELVRFFDGVGMCMNAHMRRLERSLRLTRIEGFTAADAERAMHAVMQAEHQRLRPKESPKSHWVYAGPGHALAHWHGYCAEGRWVGALQRFFGA